MVSPEDSPFSTKTTSAWAEIDADGRLALPEAVMKDFGLQPGARVRLDQAGNLLRLHRPLTQLTKVYIEPTVSCNLDCVMCFRNSWDQPIGRMSDETFATILSGLKRLDPIPSVYFGGIGEPLFHPRTTRWIKEAKALGVKVEMITNGTLLSRRKIKEIVEAGLDVLWLSLDGATPETYADVRIGAELPKILENLENLFRMRRRGHFPQPEIGIAFVAMKRNIADLPEVIRIGKRFGARYFSVSNMQPATVDMLPERLFEQVTRDIAYLNAPMLPRLSLPKMDFNQETSASLFQAFNSRLNISLAGNNWAGANDTCNFVESGTMSIAWNGDVSPCWPLMHSHMSFLHSRPRLIKKHVIGNISERSLEELWLSPEYLVYRQRLHNFAFAPCTFCGGCELAEANEEDCFGNTFPACGGCLWAQGIIQCP